MIKAFGSKVSYVSHIKMLSFRFLEAKNSTGAFFYFIMNGLPFGCGIYPSNIPAEYMPISVTHCKQIRDKDLCHDQREQILMIQP